MILEGKKVWVTGASGTIGGGIADRFEKEGREPTILIHKNLPGGDK